MVMKPSCTTGAAGGVTTLPVSAVGSTKYGLAVPGDVCEVLMLLGRMMSSFGALTIPAVVR